MIREIHIPINLNKEIGSLPDVNLEAVQPRLSQEDLNNFWDRLRTKIGTNITISIVLFVIFLFAAISFSIIWILPMQMTATKIILVVIMAIFLVLWSISHCTVKKKLNAFLSDENNQIWASRGLHWQYQDIRGKTYLELKVVPSANDYYPHEQSQCYFQGTIPSPYMQQQAYLQMTPNIQQVNLTPQMQPVNYGQQPQYQPIHNQELQGYPTNTTYVQHTNL